MKKIIGILLILAMTIALFTGCVKAGTDSSSDSIASEPTMNSQEIINSETDSSQPDETVRTETEPVIDDSLLLDANVMANYISRSIALYSTPEQPEFRQIFFVFMCSYYKDQPDFCYHSTEEINENGGLPVNIADSSEIIWQVFGQEWDITAEITSYDDTYAYIPTEIGWGMQSYHPGEYVYSSFSNDKTQVVTKFEMFGPDNSKGDPDHKSYGDYNLVYDIVGENGKTFLRFKRFEKV